MKYRRLRKEELEMLEERFVQFLAANTVTGADWEKTKLEQPEKAEGLIEIFSDLVFDETLEKVKYLQHRMPAELRCFQCLDSKIIMMGLIAQNAPDFDFRKSGTANEMMAAIKASGGSIQFFSAEKSYKFDRKEELFKMMENGCLISQGEVFRALAAVAPQGERGES